MSGEREYWQGRHEQGWRQDADPDPHFLDFLQKYQTQMGNKVVDLGCGWGRNLVPLAEQRFDVTGLEFSDEGLQQAHHNLSEKGLQGRLVKGDVHDIPFADNTFDSGICIQVLGYVDWDGAERSFKEISRILKPGALFFLRVRSDQKTLSKDAVRVPGQRGITYMDTRDGQVINGHNYSLEEIRELAAKNNFEIIDEPQHDSRSNESVVKAHWNVVLRKLDKAEIPKK